MFEMKDMDEASVILRVTVHKEGRRYITIPRIIY